MIFYSMNFRPVSDLPGLTAPPDQAITVTFHVIVPKPLWEWDDSSSIHMRFGGKKLGDWKQNVGHFDTSRYMYSDINILMSHESRHLKEHSYFNHAPMRSTKVQTLGTI